MSILKGLDLGLIRAGSSPVSEWNEYLNKMYFSIPPHSKRFLVIASGMLTSLLLLINLSFKIVIVSSMMFSISSLLCPLIAAFYLFSLTKFTIYEQRHLLIMSLISMYVFSIGVFILVNLPAAESMHNNPVYQIVFEDIPRKFFAITFAFGCSFYLPHLFFCRKSKGEAPSARKSMLLAVIGGLGFFSIDFYFLFSYPTIQNVQEIFIDSLLICSTLLLLIAVPYLAWFLFPREKLALVVRDAQSVPAYYYLVTIALTFMLICEACEYRLIAFTPNWMITASSLIFPVTIMCSTVIGEVFGYRANSAFILVLVFTQLFFEVLLMLSVSLPSPDFFNLNPYYDYILPRRIPAATLAVLTIFYSNAYLLDRLRKVLWLRSRLARIFIANLVARTLVCLVSYGLLFTGVYSYDQIISLALNAWVVKNILELSVLPFIVWLCYALEHYLRRNRVALLNVGASDSNLLPE